MSRPRGSLALFLCYDIRRPETARLIVARSFAQADSMIPDNWMSKLATPFEAYRFGKCQVELEYYWKAKETA